MRQPVEPYAPPELEPPGPSCMFEGCTAHPVAQVFKPDYGLAVAAIGSRNRRPCRRKAALCVCELHMEAECMKHIHFQRLLPDLLPKPKPGEQDAT